MMAERILIKYEQSKLNQEQHSHIWKHFKLNNNIFAYLLLQNHPTQNKCTCIQATHKVVRLHTHDTIAESFLRFAIEGRKRTKFTND